MKQVIRLCKLLSLLAAMLVLLSAAGRSAWAQGEPAIVKDSIHFTAYTNPSFHQNFDIWSWVPRTEFVVNGPINSGDQLFVEVSLPGKGVWVKFDCSTDETPAGRRMKTSCGGGDLPEEKGLTYVGPVSFAIRLRNPLSEGGVTTLFSGKTKVVKAHSNEHGPKAVNKFVYYVEHDWNLPIGYVYLDTTDPNLPKFEAKFWFRGDGSSAPGETPPAFSSIEPHLLYQGKEVGVIFIDNIHASAASCSGELTLGTTRSVAESVPQEAEWTRVLCTFPAVWGWDKTGETRTPIPGETGKAHVFAGNPGEYELKILASGRLARSMKFTVADDGTIVDNGIATANKLGSDKVIVPVRFIGTPDGVWNRLAWKTDAFYGNPLTGFTWPPPEK